MTYTHLPLTVKCIQEGPWLEVTVTDKNGRVVLWDNTHHLGTDNDLKEAIQYCDLVRFMVKSANSTQPCQN